MNIPDHIQEKLERLYTNKFIGESELKTLDKWMKQLSSDQKFEQWLFYNWESATDVPVKISYDGIQRRIIALEKQSKKQSLQKWGRRLQKIAAVLLVPALILSIWMYVSRNTGFAPMILATAKGEHTHIILPDGSEVWLNVDSRLEYSTAFNFENRNLKLNGEGFFKVAKGNEFPFVVSSSGFDVKAVGTEFNISAYADNPQAIVFMKEGVVDMKYNTGSSGSKTRRMLAGEQAVIIAKSNFVKFNQNSSNDALLWMKGELLFANESIEEVFLKTERWYNVEIEFVPKEFTKETLTLHLKKNEPISKLFEIMDQAIGIEVRQKGNIYVISKK